MVDLRSLVNDDSYKDGQLKSIARRFPTPDNVLRAIYTSKTVTEKERKSFIEPLLAEIENCDDPKATADQLMQSSVNINTTMRQWRSGASPTCTQQQQVEDDETGHVKASTSRIHTRAQTRSEKRKVAREASRSADIPSQIHSNRVTKQTKSPADDLVSEHITRYIRKQNKNRRRKERRQCKQKADELTKSLMNMDLGSQSQADGDNGQFNIVRHADKSEVMDLEPVHASLSTSANIDG